MKTVVKNLLNTKGDEVWSVSPESSVFDALNLLAKKDIGALIVMEGKKIKGMFSERDYARKIILKGKSSKETRVKDIMSEKVLYVTPERTIEECMALMTTEHIRHLPVIEEGKLIGVISIGDVVKAIISDQKFVIEQMEKYITGER